MPLTVSPSWNTLRNKPTTLEGFGITNAFANGQTWQDVTASRAKGTTYINTTSKPIFINVMTAASNTTAQLNLSVDGSAAKQFDQGIWGLSLSAIIPAGSTYVVDGLGSAGAINQWMELR